MVLLMLMRKGKKMVRKQKALITPALPLRALSRRDSGNLRLSMLSGVLSSSRAEQAAVHPWRGLRGVDIVAGRRMDSRVEITASFGAPGSHPTRDGHPVEARSGAELGPGWAEGFGTHFSPRAQQGGPIPVLFSGGPQRDFAGTAIFRQWLKRQATRLTARIQICRGRPAPRSALIRTLAYVT